MLLVNKKFLKPTKQARCVAILESLRINPCMSQAEIGRRVLISGARVNVFLRDMVKDGLIKMEPVNGKKLRYILTDKGQEVRRRLLGEYMAEIVQVYSSLKDNIKNKLREISRCHKKIAFFGASSTCEVVLSCIPDTNLNVIAIVDNDKNKQGTLFFGYIVSPPLVLRYIDIDAILITSFGRYSEIKMDILKIIKDKKLEIFNL